MDADIQLTVGGEIIFNFLLLTTELGGFDMRYCNSARTQPEKGKMSLEEFEKREIKEHSITADLASNRHKSNCVTNLKKESKKKILPIFQ